MLLLKVLKNAMIDDCEFYAEYFREVKIYNPIIILRIEKD
jgi:hypothetical protein